MKKIRKKTVTTITEESIVKNNERTLIAAILDRSGSMIDIINDAIGGFNEFLKNQKKLDGKANITVALFDDRYELLYNNVNLKKVKKITRSEWSPRGLTALYDAIGKTINTIDLEIKSTKKKNRPDKILVAIVTDGFENDSKEYTKDKVFQLIKEKEKDGWNFIYLAANQDAFEVGTSLGFSGGNTFTYTNTAEGNRIAFANLSTATATYRSVSTNDVNFDSVKENLLNNDEVSDSKDNTDE